ncbi:MAG: hypothetical protein H0X41_10140 [Chitinophagaceae bacterium]|nr:hypothetical protein [Chitinophagaceae bacterium]
MQQPLPSLTRRQFLNTSSLSAAALLMLQTTILARENQSGAPVPRLIPTLTGDIDPGNMGLTLMHEHLLFFNGIAPTDAGYQPIPENLRQESIDFAADRINDAARMGVETLVDVGPYRPIDLYQEIASRTRVKIIVSTGFYRESKRPQWAIDMTDPHEMVNYMLKESQEGIGGTKLRAGIIKVAQEKSPMSDWEKKVFQAAATVQKKTGINIATHTGNAVEQFNVLTKAGADPKKIYFSHVDVRRNGKVGDLLPLLQAGAYLEVDTFGQAFNTSEAVLAAFIRDVCDAGYANKLFISIDSNWHWVNGEKKFEGAEAPRLDPLASKRTFSYMFTDVIPTLFKFGFSMNEIRTFLVDNPQNYFERYS